jgi:hypothetical protein
MVVIAPVNATIDELSTLIEETRRQWAQRSKTPVRAGTRSLNASSLALCMSHP